MKKIIVFFLSVFFLSSCLSCESEDKYIDPTVMPEETTSGNNTFGCLVDGWVYTSGRYLNQPLTFWYYREQNLFEVKVEVRLESYITFIINQPTENQTCTFEDALFDSESLGSGEVKITRFDREQKILSGTFSGGRITHGRFDVVYEVREMPVYPEEQ